MPPATLIRTAACRLALASLAAVGVAGCVHGSVATDTGPRPPGHKWSTAGRQQVHAGETVRFDFVLHDAFRQLLSPVGLADYCVTVIDGERIETTPDLNGHFGFSHRFTGLEPGDTVTVKTEAYQLRGGRDHMKIGGQWFASESPYEQRDRKIAQDAVRLSVYQMPIELTLVRPPDDLDPDTGVMYLRRDDGTTNLVYVDRPGRPGFSISGPEPDGVYRFRYVPSGNELSPAGVTEVELTIYDRSGQARYVSTTLDTP